MEKINQMVQRLTQGGVQFVIVGGYAAVAHGSSLMTRDLDICCSFSFENLMRLQSVLTDYHPAHRLTPQKLPLELDKDFCSGLKNLDLETDLCILDCLGEVLGVGRFAAVLENSVEVKLPEGSCRVLDLDALITAKKAMNRPRDHQTVRQLEAIKERLHNPKN